mgnify:CR=1 FL=1
MSALVYTVSIRSLLGLPAPLPSSQAAKQGWADLPPFAIPPFANFLLPALIGTAACPGLGVPMGLPSLHIRFLDTCSFPAPLLRAAPVTILQHNTAPLRHVGWPTSKLSFAGHPQSTLGRYASQQQVPTRRALDAPCLAFALIGMHTFLTHGMPVGVSLPSAFSDTPGLPSFTDGPAFVTILPPPRPSAPDAIWAWRGNPRYRASFARLAAAKPIPVSYTHLRAHET